MYLFVEVDLILKCKLSLLVDVGITLRGRDQNEREANIYSLTEFISTSCFDFNTVPL